jgi:hypothetical protein
MIVWKSLRGKQTETVIDKTIPDDYVPPPKKPIDDGQVDVLRAYEHLSSIGYVRQWNLKMGIALYNSLWVHENGSFVLVQWWRDTGAVEVLIPCEAPTLEEVFNQISEYTKSNEESS